MTFLRFSANVSNNPHDFFESKLLLEGHIEKQAAVDGNWEALANADNITLELSAFYKMFKEMTLRMSNDSEIEKSYSSRRSCNNKSVYYE